jgi:hypothetical protein
LLISNLKSQIAISESHSSQFYQDLRNRYEAEAGIVAGIVAGAGAGAAAIDASSIVIFLGEDAIGRIILKLI